MIISCYTERNSDHFYIPDKNNIDELKEYAENNMPIKCYELQKDDLGSIYIIDFIKEVYLYLNNYLYYKDVSNLYYLKTEKEIEQIEKKYCKNCIHYSNSYFDCRYVFRENRLNKCSNFQERKGLFKFIQNIFK